MQIDLDQARADTPASAGVAHLNNCGSSLPPQAVVDAMVGYLQAEALIGGYEVAADRQADLDEFYSATSSYLGCDPTEVAFANSAADAWWRAFTSVPLSRRDRILVNRSEYQANAFGWLWARDRGVQVDVIPNDSNGLTDLDAMADMLDERVKLISFTMISLGNGAIQPAAEAVRRVRACGSEAIFLLDACQAAGQMRLDVDELGCDFLVYTGRKFMRGPRGTGALFARSEVLDRLERPIFIDGRSGIWGDDGLSVEPMPGAQRFEFGEFGYAAKVGLGVATRYMLELGIDQIAERVTGLAADLRLGLGEIPGVTVHDEGVDRCAIVTFTIDGVDPTTAGTRLRSDGIHVSTPMRPAAQLDLGARGLNQVVRAGVHYFNSRDELERLCQSVRDLAR